jgi:hypothetical protein
MDLLHYWLEATTWGGLSGGFPSWTALPAIERLGFGNLGRGFMRGPAGIWAEETCPV